MLQSRVFDDVRSAANPKPDSRCTHSRCWDSGSPFDFQAAAKRHTDSTATRECS